ncbi:MAG TPA: ribosome maturation factor RimP [Thermoanaerobaculia bacterium]|nr:ribosome maturation factor RimP [Thermoanaerobaculia bacterium]
MSRFRITPALEEELSAIAAEQGCELVHVGFRGGTLQIMLDHPDGVNLAHCEAVSKQASALLDLEDFGGSRYVLEVTSPGLDRPLLRPADYQRFQGRRVRVTFREGSERTKRTVAGTLEAFDSDREVARVRDDEAGSAHSIPLADIQSARLQIEL